MFITILTVSPWFVIEVKRRLVRSLFTHDSVSIRDLIDYIRNLSRILVIRRLNRRGLFYPVHQRGSYSTHKTMYTLFSWIRITIKNIYKKVHFSMMKKGL